MTGLPLEPTLSAAPVHGLVRAPPLALGTDQRLHHVVPIRSPSHASCLRYYPAFSDVLQSGAPSLPPEPHGMRTAQASIGAANDSVQWAA